LAFLNIIAILCTIAAFTTHFDRYTWSSPFWIISIPFSLLLLNYTVICVINCYYEQDECTRLFNGYDTKIKKCMVTFNSITTFIYCLSLITNLYMLDLAHTNDAEDKQIVLWALYSSLIYSILMVENTGSYILNIFFDQFLSEMMN